MITRDCLSFLKKLCSRMTTFHSRRELSNKTCLSTLKSTYNLFFVSINVPFEIKMIDKLILSCFAIKLELVERNSGFEL